MAKILIIGGTRYLGLEITRLLARRRPDQVYVLNRGVTRPVLPQNVQRVMGDISNVTDLVSAVTSLKPDFLIDTILDAETLARLLPSLGGWLKRFIHTGSIGVYGDTCYLPAREEDTPRPRFGFEGKLAQDEVVLKHITERGLPATILRVSYIFGRGDIPLELWGGRNPEFFRRLQRGEEVLVPGDGKPLLHPGHVTDLARSFLLCLESDVSIGKVYNIGGERSLTLAKYLEVLGEALGVEPHVHWQPVEKAAETLVKEGFADRDGLLFLMQHMSVDISKAKTELGYSPDVILEEGMRDNINWMREEGIIG